MKGNPGIPSGAPQPGVRGVPGKPGVALQALAVVHPTLALAIALTRTRQIIL